MCAIWRRVNGYPYQILSLTSFLTHHKSDHQLLFNLLFSQDVKVFQFPSISLLDLPLTIRTVAEEKLRTVRTG